MTEGIAEMSLAVAAHRLGLSWPQAWRLLLRQELDGRRVGSRWLVTKASVERLAQSRLPDDRAG